jgi:hypothetical protein
MDQPRRRNSTGEQVMLEVDMRGRGKQTMVSDYKKK